MKIIQPVTVIMGIAGLLFSAFVWAGDTTTFTWSVPAGTCDVNIPVLPGDLGVVNANNLLGTNWVYVNKKNFTITLSSCLGVGGSARPVITISGNTTTGPNGSGYIFKSSSPDKNTSVGFGFVIIKAAKAAGDDGDIEALNGERLYVPKASGGYYERGESLGYGTYNIPLTAAVTCGRVAWCTATALKAGTLKADITFTFAYK